MNGKSENGYICKDWEMKDCIFKFYCSFVWFLYLVNLRLLCTNWNFKHTIPNWHQKVQKIILYIMVATCIEDFTDEHRKILKMSLKNLNFKQIMSSRRNDVIHFHKIIVFSISIHCWFSYMHVCINYRAKKKKSRIRVFVP